MTFEKILVKAIYLLFKNICQQWDFKFTARWPLLGLNLPYEWQLPFSCHFSANVVYLIIVFVYYHILHFSVFIHEIQKCCIVINFELTLSTEQIFVKFHILKFLFKRFYISILSVVSFTLLDDYPLMSIFINEIIKGIIPR